MCTSPPALPISSKACSPRKMSLPEVSAERIAATIKEKCAPFKCDLYGEGKHTLHIIPAACDELDAYVKYGKKHPSNVCEQQLVGMGHSFMDSNGGIQTVVTRIIPVCSASRGPTHAKVVSEGNDAMLDVLENERKLQNQLESTYNTDENGYTIDPFLGNGPSEVNLFGHTHPGLTCFFSSVDHGSNYSTPSKPIVTFVCDPILKDMKAMVGVKGEKMRVIAYRPKAALPTNTHQRISTPREFTVDELWQRVSAVANLLLQQAGVNGNFDCHHDWRGRTHMQFKVTYRPLKRTHKD